MFSSRVRLIITALVLGPVLLYWGLGIAPSERRTEPPEALQKDQDYFATDTRSRVFGDDGRLEQSMSTPRLDHFPEQRLSKLATPHVELFGDDGSKTVIDARRGELPDDRSEALLSGDVRVIDHTTAGTQTKLYTERLTLLPNSEEARTELPVTILSDNVRYDATGMKASFKSQTLELLSNVQGTHENEK